MVGLLFYACDGQTKKNICTSDIAIKKISQLPEIVKHGKYFSSLKDVSDGGKLHNSHFHSEKFNVSKIKTIKE